MLEQFTMSYFYLSIIAQIFTKSKKKTKLQRKYKQKHETKDKTQKTQEHKECAINKSIFINV